MRESPAACLNLGEHHVTTSLGVLQSTQVQHGVGWILAENFADVLTLPSERDGDFAPGGRGEEAIGSYAVEHQAGASAKVLPVQRPRRVAAPCAQSSMGCEGEPVRNPAASRLGAGNVEPIEQCTVSEGSSQLAVDMDESFSVLFGGKASRHGDEVDIAAAGNEAGECSGAEDVESDELASEGLLQRFGEGVEKRADAPGSAPGHGARISLRPTGPARSAPARGSAACP